MKTKEYRHIEYTDDHDFVIANVVMDEDKIVSVKLTEGCLTNHTEFVELQEFVDEIKSMPWKYDDNEQACEDWYKSQGIDLTSATTP
jgi:pyrimidine deaminase RibD-like protein